NVLAHRWVRYDRLLPDISFVRPNISTVRKGSALAESAKRGTEHLQSPSSGDLPQLRRTPRYLAVLRVIDINSSDALLQRRRKSEIPRR
ncbi:unnamed protein product, partial [Mycena citricolor]